MIFYPGKSAVTAFEKVSFNGHTSLVKCKYTLRNRNKTQKLNAFNNTHSRLSENGSNASNQDSFTVSGVSDCK